jgi:hypothetical protein
VYNHLQFITEENLKAKQEEEEESAEHNPLE